MIPFRINNNVVVDPSAELRFGPIKKSLYKLIGKVKEISYFKMDRCTTYRVEFPNGESLWFKENELL